MHTLREWVRRIWGTLGRGRRDADLEMEVRLHAELAAEAEQRRGVGAADAARAARLRLGGLSQTMDALRDQRGVPRLDSLLSDVVCGWRQLNRHRTATIVAIVSLGLAIGATTTAFRLVDAVLVRPLPVAEPDRLFAIATTFVNAENRPDYNDDFDYLTLRAYAEAAGDRADVMVVGLTGRQAVMFAGGDEPDLAFRQYFSGNVFGSLGLAPAVGRLLGPEDDRTPGGHPVAVLSHDFWTRRFGRDPSVVGSTIRVGSQPYEIVGVAPRGFTGTEPGIVTDLFLPAMMNVQALTSPGWSWFQIWIRPRPGVAAEQVRQVLQARHTADLRRRLEALPADTPKEKIDGYLSQQVLLLPAGSGVSGTKKTFQTKDLETTMEIIGLVGDAAYASVREPMRPTVYLPIESRSGVAFVVRTAGEPMAVAATLRREVVRLRSDLRVRDVAPLTAFVRQQMVRERLLAALSSFFALVALALAAVGLYGVLNYAVVRQRREIGIRMALGARAGHVIRKVTTGMLALVCTGWIAGLVAAVAFGRVVQALLFQVSAADPATMMLSMLALGVAAACAVLPPVLRATRIEPAETLRTE